MRVAILDLIRFSAALSVVLYHYIARVPSETFPFLAGIAKYGYLGVPIFFIISGFVIAITANNRAPFQFAVSRIVRLYPGLWLSALFTVVVVSIFSEQRYSLMQVLANFTLINEYLGFEDLDGVYWTLKAELKFYACVFVLLALNIFQKFTLWLSIWIATTLTYMIWDQPFFLGWFITPAYSPFFIAGVAFYLIKSNIYPKFALTCLGVSLLMAGIKTYQQADNFMLNPSDLERVWAVLIMGVFCALMYLICIGKIGMKESPLLTSIGALTYPLYLIHNMAGRAIISHYSATTSLQVLIPLVIVLMITLAWLIHHLGEKPLAALIARSIKKLFPKAGQRDRPL